MAKRNGFRRNKGLNFGVNQSYEIVSRKIDL